MYFYGSTEWLNLFQETLNASDKYRKAAANFTARMLITTSLKGISKPIYVWMNQQNGEMKEWAYLASEKEKPSDYTFIADYFTWKAICQGNIDVLKAVATGKIKLKGNKFKLLKQTKTSLSLLEIMKKLPTEFPDDAFQRA